MKKENIQEIQGNQLKEGKIYTITEDLGVFKKGEKVIVESIRRYGGEIRIELKGNKGKKDYFILDINDDINLD